MTMLSRRELTQSAIARALRARREADVPLWDAACPFDLAERLGVEVRFQALASAEGMRGGDGSRYTIVVSSLRPSGRQAFTCAHELAHEIFDHGVRIDELVDLRDTPRRNEPEEIIADAFAGALLMPKVAVDRGMALRGWNVGTCGPREMYGLANWLGVGYTTLISHLQHGLRTIDGTRAETLRRVWPAFIRQEILGSKPSGNLLIVDSHWRGRPVDIQIDDLVLMPPDGCAAGDCIGVESDESDRVLLRGITPGIGRLSIEDQGWSSFVRVSRHGYVGRNCYRHLEEADEDR